MRRKHGFTLIELLVVVAIIAVLVALLLPVMKGARDRAKQLICISQERQVALAFQQYEDEWNSSLPTTGDYWAPLEGRARNSAPYHKRDSWINLLSEPYLRTGSAPNGYCALKKSSVWLCPNDVTDGGGGVYNGPTYGVNRYLTGWYSPARQQTPYRVTALAEPFKTPLMFDVPYDHWGGYPSHAVEGHTRGKFPPHYDNGGDNFLFVDGHVQWIPMLESRDATPTQTFYTYWLNGKYFVQNTSIWY